MLRKYDDEYNKEKIYITHFGFIKNRTIKTKWTAKVNEKWISFSILMTPALINCLFEIIIIINAVDELIQFHTI